MKRLGFILAMILLHTCHASNNLHPLILIPGNGGNQLEARLTSAYKPSSLLCNRWYPVQKDKEGWFRLWFDLSVLLSPFTKCFSERMMLYYDDVLDDYRNAPGVETRVPNFGSTQSLLYLDPHLKQITSYMEPLVKSLEQIGYIDGKTLFGAPYDFRYGLAAKGHPCQVGSKFLHDLKHLIEKVSKSNGGKPVILLSHSLGALFTHHLLNRTPPSWHQKFIKHFITLSAPWGGTVQEMLTFASGYSLGVPLVDPLLVRDEQRSSESNLWLLPNPKIFGPKTPLVITPNGNYSSYNISQFLDAINFSQGVKPYESRVLPLFDEVAMALDVGVTCIIGSGIDTVETLFYGTDGFDKQPEVVYGDGDGTVNMVSLLGLETLWGEEKINQEIKVIRIDGVSHTSILKDDVALKEIIGEICGINYAALSSLL